jgi:hypothetical protein
MGKLIIRNNGVETQLVNGVDFTSLSGTPNTYVIGVDPTLGTFEKLNPDGSIINYDSGVGEVFTGGTVTGETIFEGGLSATTISGDTFYGDGSNLTGIGGGTFTGGTVTGETFFEGGLSATTISGDGSLISGLVGLTYSDLGFTITSTTPVTINQNVVLPYNATLTYPTPLTVGVGFSVVIPNGTTLSIV